MSICGGIAGYRGAPIGCFIHNDAGSINATAEWWANAYATGRHDLRKGFVHAHADAIHVIECEDDTYAAWHCGNAYYNSKYLSIEVDQSEGANDDLFLINEQNAFKWVANKFIKWNISPNETTIMLHKEVYPTACPARSCRMHPNCKQYFIEQVTKYMIGKIKEEQMQCTFNVEGDPEMGTGVFFYDGYGIKPIGHPDELFIIRDIYKRNNDKDMPNYTWQASAPWYRRLISVVSRDYMAKPNKNEILKKKKCN